MHTGQKQLKRFLSADYPGTTFGDIHARNLCSYQYYGFFP